MQRRLITIPRSLMRLREADWDIDWRNRGAGTSNSGLRQVVVSGEPVWTAELELSLNREQAREWTAIRASLRGRVNICRVPMVDPENLAEWEFGVSGETWTAGVPFSDGNFFSTGAGFAYSPVVLSDIEVPRGAEGFLIQTSDCPVEIRPGMLISHDDWPYRVTGVQNLGADLRRLTVEMPVRRAIPGGAPIQLLAHGLFALAVDDTGRLAFQKRGRQTVKLSLREWIKRP